MKRSYSVLAAVCALAVSVASWAGDMSDRVAVAAERAWCAVWNFGAKVLAGPAPVAEAGEVKPRTYPLAARYFHQRLVKRERSVISQEWRMCPSI